MSRDFILNEPATSFAEMQRACLSDLFCNNVQDSLQAQDKKSLGFINLAFRQYGKLQRKAQKQNSNQAATLNIEGVDNNIAQAVNNFTCVDNMSDANSILCDNTDILFPMLNLQTPRNFKELDSVLQSLILSGDLHDTLISYAPHAHLFALANHRSIIKCPKLELNDDILLNSSKLLSKLPLWSLCLDLTGCTQSNSDGEKITGLSIMRTTFGLGAQNTINQIKKSQKHKNNNASSLAFDGITIMLCTDNESYSIFEVPFILDEEISIEDLIVEPFLVEEQELEKLQSDAALHNETLNVSEITFNGEKAHILCPLDLIESLKEAMKYVCYVLTHQQNIINEQGQVAELNNIDMLSILPKGSNLASLGDESLPLNVFSLKA